MRCGCLRLSHGKCSDCPEYICINCMFTCHLCKKDSCKSHSVTKEYGCSCGSWLVHEECDSHREPTKTCSECHGEICLEHDYFCYEKGCNKDDVLCDRCIYNTSHRSHNCWRWTKDNRIQIPNGSIFQV